MVPSKATVLEEVEIVDVDVARSDAAAKSCSSQEIHSCYNNAWQDIDCHLSFLKFGACMQILR